FTATPTFSVTRTGTDTRTSTISATHTASPTDTRTYTQTATGTATHTPTATPTDTGTNTFTATPTFTATATPTYTRTRTATATPTPTFTATPTATYTATPTFTSTRTVTMTVTPTPTFTALNSATATGTATQTPTFTRTATWTFTASPTATATKDTARYDLLAPASATAGSPFWVTLTALSSDFYGPFVINEAYSGTAHFYSAPSSSILPEDYTYAPALDMGQHLFRVTLNQAGLYTIYANDTVYSSVSASAQVWVSAGTALNFAVTAPSFTDAGAAFWVTVQAKDANNNIASGYTGTARLNSTDPLALYLGDVIFLPSDNGTKYVLVTLYTAGVHRIQAVDTVAPQVNGTSNEITVRPGSLAGFSVQAPSITSANSVFNYVVTARDAYNNIITGYTGTVHFTSGDTSPMVSLPADLAFQASDMGARIFQAVLQTAGFQTISVNDVSQPGVNGVSNPINVVVPAVSYERPLLLTSYLVQANRYEFVYLQFDDRDHTFSGNEYLEYDVFVPEYSSNFYCSTEYQDGNFGDMRDYGQATQNYIRDQNAIRIHPSMDISAFAKESWYRRKFDVSMLSGTYYSNGYLSQDTGNIGYNGAPSNNAGTFNAFFDNITYKNASGTIVWDCFSNTFTMKVGAGIVRSTINTGGSWRSNAAYPTSNYIWVIDGWKAWASPQTAVPADGVSSATITAYVWAPDVGANTRVS
ncbi:MAG TPA: hypothetical protein P5511_05070, partial [Candidatus Goldiibacteriota bacterium]|nr:hypothetical protein [Candidatus Goldiibacteriota bacterium]